MVPINEINEVGLFAYHPDINIPVTRLITVACEESTVICKRIMVQEITEKKPRL